MAQPKPNPMSPGRDDAVQALALLSAEKARRPFPRSAGLDTATAEGAAAPSEMSGVGATRALEFGTNGARAGAAQAWGRGGTASAASSVAMGDDDDEEEDGEEDYEDGYEEGDAGSGVYASSTQGTVGGRSAGVVGSGAAGKTGKGRGAAARGSAARTSNGYGANYCRKEKSLGLLTDNFLRYCRSQPDGVVSLDHAAVSLGVERRRIYDVTNILEALDVVSRKTKNQYTWHGTGHLHRTLKRLQDSALIDAGRFDDLVPTDALVAGTASLPPNKFFGTLHRKVPVTEATSALILQHAQATGTAPPKHGLLAATRLVASALPHHAQSAAAAAAAPAAAATAAATAVLPGAAPGALQAQAQAQPQFTMGGFMVAAPRVNSVAALEGGLAAASAAAAASTAAAAPSTVTAADPSAFTLDLAVEFPTFPDPMMNFLSVPPQWLEPPAGVGKRGTRSGMGSTTTAAVAAAASNAAAAAAASAAAQRATAAAVAPEPLDSAPAKRKVGRPFKKPTAADGAGGGSAGAGGAGGAVGHALVPLVGLSVQVSPFVLPPGSTSIVRPEALEGVSAIVTVSVSAEEAAAAIGTAPSCYSFRPALPLLPPLSQLVTPLGSSWSNDIVDVECALEEDPLPFHLRSLPLLSELLYSGMYSTSGAAAQMQRRARRDRSLGILTQRFVKVFLLDRKVITLDFAAPVVIPEDDEEEDEDHGEGLDGAPDATLQAYAVGRRTGAIPGGPLNPVALMEAAAAANAAAVAAQAGETAAAAAAAAAASTEPAAAADGEAAAEDASVSAGDAANEQAAQPAVTTAAATATTASASSPDATARRASSRRPVPVSRDIDDVYTSSASGAGGAGGAGAGGRSRRGSAGTTTGGAAAAAAAAAMRSHGMVGATALSRASSTASTASSASSMYGSASALTVTGGPAAASSTGGAGGAGAPSGLEAMSESNRLKIRRLYDIANVLCALRLIDRVHVRGRQAKKPAFRWRGPAYVEPVCGVPLPDWALTKVIPAGTMNGVGGGSSGIATSLSSSALYDGGESSGAATRSRTAPVPQRQSKRRSGGGVALGATGAAGAGGTDLEHAPLTRSALAAAASVAMAAAASSSATAAASTAATSSSHGGHGAAIFSVPRVLPMTASSGSPTALLPAAPTPTPMYSPGAATARALLPAGMTPAVIDGLLESPGSVTGLLGAAATPSLGLLGHGTGAGGSDGLGLGLSISPDAFAFATTPQAGGGGGGLGMSRLGFTTMALGMGLPSDLLGGERGAPSAGRLVAPRSAIPFGLHSAGMGLGMGSAMAGIGSVGLEMPSGFPSASASASGDGSGAGAGAGAGGAGGASDGATTGLAGRKRDRNSEDGVLGDGDGDVSMVPAEMGSDGLGGHGYGANRKRRRRLLNSNEVPRPAEDLCAGAEGDGEMGSSTAASSSQLLAADGAASAPASSGSAAATTPATGSLDVTVSPHSAVNSTASTASPPRSATGGVALQPSTFLHGSSPGSEALLSTRVVLRSPMPSAQALHAAVQEESAAAAAAMAVDEPEGVVVAIGFTESGNPRSPAPAAAAAASTSASASTGYVQLTISPNSKKVAAATERMKQTDDAVLALLKTSSSPIPPEESPAPLAVQSGHGHGATAASAAAAAAAIAAAADDGDFDPSASGMSDPTLSSSRASSAGGDTSMGASGISGSSSFSGRSSGRLSVASPATRSSKGKEVDGALSVSALKTGGGTVTRKMLGRAAAASSSSSTPADPVAVAMAGLSSSSSGGATALPQGLSPVPALRFNEL